MNNKILIITFFSLIIIGSIGCQGGEIYTEEFIEVFEVDSSSEEKAKGSLKFKESYVKDQKGRDIAHGIYNLDNSLKGIENYLYKDENKNPIGSEYVEGDKVLSFYKFEFDKKNKKIKSYAFDGISNELLRKEEYGYDAEGNRNMKVVKTSQDSVVRIYKFQHDEFGNETEVNIFNGAMQPLTTENYTIVSKNTEGKWTEKWGHVNNTVSSFSKRYWKETKKK